MKIAGGNSESVRLAEKISIYAKNKHHLETFLSVHIKHKVLLSYETTFRKLNVFLVLNEAHFLNLFI